MNRKDKEILLKLLKHAENVKDFISDVKDKSVFVNNSMIIYATAFELLQIGELAKKQLSDDIKKDIDGIPWDSIYGLRNRIVHGYDSVDQSILWETVTEDVPVLAEELKEYLKRSNS